MHDFLFTQVHEHISCFPSPHLLHDVYAKIRSSLTRMVSHPQLLCVFLDPTNLVLATLFAYLS